MASEGFNDLVRRAQDGDRAAMDRVLETLRPHLEHLARPYANPAKARREHVGPAPGILPPGMEQDRILRGGLR